MGEKMFKIWDGHDSLKCVVLCAGRGTRMEPTSSEKPKVMLDVHGKPLLHYVVEYWKQFTDNFVFIVGYKKEMVIDYLSKESIVCEFVEQKERKGIAHAVLQAEEKVGDRFIVTLGDCLCKGDFLFPAHIDQGVGVFKTDNMQSIMQSYSVETDGGVISRVVEKPKVLANNFCGMGFYFFRKKLFDYIRKTPASTLRNEVEITDAIQMMIDSGESVIPVWFSGDYINVTFPEDVEKAKRLIGLVPER